MTVLLDTENLLGGAERVRTRVRGFAPWSPQADTRALLEQVRAVFEEYHDYLPLTIRQIFYRLVGRYEFEKTERAYGRLCEHLNRARRARLIPMDHIRDDGATVIRPVTYADDDNADGLSIPDFMRIPAEERRRAWAEWKGWLTRPAPTNAPTNAVREEFEQRQRAKTQARISKMKALKAERDTFSSIPRSRRRWDPTRCKFISEST
jgi:hypothetical protein